MVVFNAQDTSCLSYSMTTSFLFDDYDKDEVIPDNLGR